MRKIEQKMLKAIEKCQHWKEGNTHVMTTLAEPPIRVFLHGNEIAVVDENGDMWANKLTFRRWPTVTTCSRLRALGFDARIKNHRPMLDGEEV